MSKMSDLINGYIQDLQKPIWYLNREIEAYNSNKVL